MYSQLEEHMTENLLPAPCAAPFGRAPDSLQDHGVHLRWCAAVRDVAAALRKGPRHSGLCACKVRYLPVGDVALLGTSSDLASGDLQVR